MYIHLPIKMRGLRKQPVTQLGLSLLGYFLAPFFMGPDERKRRVNGPRQSSFDNIIRTDFAVVVLTRL